MDAESYDYGISQATIVMSDMYAPISWELVVKRARQVPLGKKKN